MLNRASNRGRSSGMPSTFTEERPVPIEDPSFLPTNCFLHVIGLLLGNTNIFVSRTQSQQSVACTGSCALVTCALVSKRWRSALHSEEARDTLWRRIRLEDCCLSRKIDADKFRSTWLPVADRLLEIVVELSPTFQTRRSVCALAAALPENLDKAKDLRSLRLSGPLPYGEFLKGVDFGQFLKLKSLFLGSGHNVTWQPCDIIQSCADLPSLRELEIRLSSDVDEVDPDLAPSLGKLTQLHHLSLQWPSKSALPPIGDMPDSFGNLTRLTTLKLKHVPQQSSSPEWLASFTNLKALFWDPYLPVDMTGLIPPALKNLKMLQTLYIEVKVPFSLPKSLTALKKLIIVGRGICSAASSPVANDDRVDTSDTSSENAIDSLSTNRNDWGWLEPMQRLVCLRLQGVALSTLPEEVQKLSGLTRLGLMCNELSAEGLPFGPWVHSLQYLHLGNNCIHSFPPSLRHASQLRALHLANQRSSCRETQFSKNKSQKLVLMNEDVDALVRMPLLELIVMSMGQAAVHVDGQMKDFEWLQKILKRKSDSSDGCIRLTTNELAYKLEPLAIFQLQRLTHHEFLEISLSEG